MKKALVLGWVLAGVAACAPMDPITSIHVKLDRATVPADLDPDDVELDIAAAVAFWAGCGYDMTFAGQGKIVRFATMEGAAGREAPTGPELNVSLPWIFDGDSCEPGDAGYYLGEVLRHELGHALGLEHEPEIESVMYAYHLPCDQKLWSETCPRQSP